jgi:release factor glutamine methyltransferase
MWAVCGDARFDLVVTNLPQFAAEHIEGDGRLPTWSAGGPTAAAAWTSSSRA